MGAGRPRKVEGLVQGHKVSQRGVRKRLHESRLPASALTTSWSSALATEGGLTLQAARLAFCLHLWPPLLMAGLRPGTFCSKAQNKFQWPLSGWVEQRWRWDGPPRITLGYDRPVHVVGPEWGVEWAPSNKSDMRTGQFIQSRDSASRKKMEKEDRGLREMLGVSPSLLIKHFCSGIVYRDEEWVY